MLAHFFNTISTTTLVHTDKPFLIWNTKSAHAHVRWDDVSGVSADGSSRQRAQWLALLPHSKNVLGSNLLAGALLCMLWLALCGFFLSTLHASCNPRTRMFMILNWMWVWMLVQHLTVDQSRLYTTSRPGIGCRNKWQKMHKRMESTAW